MQNQFIMKPNIFYFLFVLLIFSCAKQDDDAGEQYCNNARVIRPTCGGTVVQILRPDNIGREWTDFFTPDKPSYANCVLVGNIPQEKQVENSIISIKYKIVEQLDGLFCEIGGLPSVNAKVVKLYPNCQITND